MERDELKDYLSFYRDALRRDPENVEARLRLAGIFRQLDKPEMAISEYETASKILAKRGLPLEAIAACKAILELDPEHTDTQMFLAQLYARNPDAGDSSMRIATPLERVGDARSRQRQSELEQLDELREAHSDDLEPLHEVDESTDVTARPGPNEEPTQVDAEPPAAIEQSGDEGEQKLQLDSDRLDSVSREEMDHLLSTTDIGPEDIVSVENSPVGALPGGDPTFQVDVFDLESLDVGDELPPEWQDDLPDPEQAVSDDVEQQGSPRGRRLSTPTSSTVAVEPSKLPEIPLFSQVDASIFVDLLSAIDIVEGTKDSTLIEYGDENRRLYVIVDGEVLASRTTEDEEVVTLSRLGPGEFFGEFGMLTQQRSGATVTATSDVRLLSFPRNVVIRVCLAYPDIWESLWDFYHVRRLDNLMKLHPVFRRLPTDARDDLRDAFKVREFLSGEEVLAPGDTAEEVMAVSVGELDVTAADGGREPASRHPGELVGLVSGVRQRPVQHRVVAAQETAVLCVSSSTCASIVEDHPQVDRMVESRPYPADLTDID